MSFSRRFRRQQGGSQSKVDVASAVAELRHRMLNATQLSEISSYFDDVLVPNDAFIKAGSPGSHEILLSIAEAAAKVTIDCGTPIERRLIHVSEYGLWHGMLIFDTDTMGRLLYFAVENRGLLSIGKLSNPMTHELRFSVPEELTEPVNPADVTLASFGRRGAPSKPS